MDLVLEVCDTYVFDWVYERLLPTSLYGTVPESWAKQMDLNSGVQNITALLKSINTGNEHRTSPERYGHVPYLTDMTAATFGSLLRRSNYAREMISLTIVVTVFGWLLYLLFATGSYFLVFDKNIFNHPKFLKNQMALEIKLAMFAIPVMSFLTSICFMFELNGFSKLYATVDINNGGIRKLLFEFPLFILFTDCGIYLAHRWLHWPTVYKVLHKPHHKWLVCTPFASHAFHPVDGFIQSLPYHIYPMIMPLNKYLYLFLFTFVNFWTIMIHDGNHMSQNPYVNGTAFHTVHHLYFNYNYGQFTTLWDRLGGSYRKPEDSLFNPELNKDAKALDEQLRRIDEIQRVVEEDEDDRIYSNISKKKNSR
ncbi:hypothetical protein TPHA_0P00250 [Tetrapisispora phaffii CBS 4417]|uniref:Fatty acid hydroxylase domain-containing protein n=1 Tax=Tetrapisispora phaffii (strain ATCC 24235 / CBS 4417 / NBRC 1672 / NRRL Y-8282 / UCD 70-5) TaxID=1071381 RepID=G8C205_TETPH|nr:hypothetical protein TPHA_0P00250 [Tetrapisispora phaffii CBS 4417]CCE66183.1 hypothetical protein TPHA_0P00250 [Tetrapisispora phaffii CBS 4417]